jgi:hypothetical protein
MQQPNPRAQSNGVLQVSAARISGKPAPKQAAGPRLKVIIRRLAPGLTEEEFWKYLGTEWTVGQGRVDWASYKNGKDSKECVYHRLVDALLTFEVYLSLRGHHEPTYT